jgi:hypothetical protein
MQHDGYAEATQLLQQALARPSDPPTALQERLIKRLARCQRLASIPGAVIQLRPGPGRLRLRGRDLGERLADLRQYPKSTAMARRAERRSTARNPQVMTVAPSALSEFASRSSLALFRQTN